MDYQTKFYQGKVLCPLLANSSKQSTLLTCGSIRIRNEQDGHASFAISCKGKGAHPSAQENAMSFFFMQPTPTMISAIQTLYFSAYARPVTHVWTINTG